jgi:hypothetical protein
MKLKITKEKVLEAASKCETAKETLKTLFPEVFEDDKYFDLCQLNRYRREDGRWFLFSKKQAQYAGFNNECFMQVREMSSLKGISFYLDDAYNWEMTRDNEGITVLIPTKK